MVTIKASRGFSNLARSRGVNVPSSMSSGSKSGSPQQKKQSSDPYVSKFGKTRDQLMASSAAKQAKELAAKFEARGNTETASQLSNFAKLVQSKGSIKGAEQELSKKSSYLSSQLKQERQAEQQQQQIEEQQQIEQQQAKKSQLSGGLLGGDLPGQKFVDRKNTGFREDTSTFGKAKSIYKKADTAVLGFLPGAEAPEDVITGFSQSKNPVKRFIADRPEFIYFRNIKAIRKVGSKVVKKITPSPDTVRRIEKERFEQAQKLYEAGQLRDVKGFEALNIFSKDPNVKISRSIKNAVREGKTLEEFRQTGSGTRGTAIALEGLNLTREKPVELVEGISQIYFTGKATASAVNFLTSKIPVTSKAGKIAVDLLVSYPAQSEIVGRVTESQLKQKGFTEQQAKTGAFAARVFQAEAFGNIEGSKAFARNKISKIRQIKNLKEAFKLKITAGFAEGSTAGLALADYKPDAQLYPTTILGKTVNLGGPSIKVGGDQILPSFKDGEVKLGKVGTAATFGALGAVSAGSFGVLEKAAAKSKAGSKLVEVTGFISDPPEYPGDVLTPGFTPFGGLKLPNAKVKTPTFAFIKESSGSISDVLENGGEISRTKVKLKTEDIDFLGIKETIKVDTSSSTKTRQTAPIRDTTPTKTKDIIRGSKGGTRSVIKGNINVVAITGSKDTVQSLLDQPSKSDITLPTETTSPTDVDVPTLTDNFFPQPANVFVTTNTNTNTNIDVPTTTMTPRLIIPPLFPGGGGGRRGKFKSFIPKVKGKYTPSLTAAALNIKGSIPSLSTGLGIRPIISKPKRKKKKR